MYLILATVTESIQLAPFCSMASHGQHCSHGPKTTLKKSGSSLPLQPIFQNRIFQNYLNCIEKGQKEHTKCYMISNPTPKFTSQIRSIQSVFGRNRTETGSKKIDRIDRNRISGRTLLFSLILKLNFFRLIFSTFCLFNINIYAIS